MSLNFNEELVSPMPLYDQSGGTHPSVTECQQFLYADPRIKYFFEYSNYTFHAPAVPKPHQYGTHY